MFVCIVSECILFYLIRPPPALKRALIITDIIRLQPIVLISGMRTEIIMIYLNKLHLINIFNSTKSTLVFGLVVVASFIRNAVVMGVVVDRKIIATMA